MKVFRSEVERVVSGRWSVVGILFLLFVIHCSLFTIQAQTTEFTYQGSLTNAGSPANGDYDFEFRVFGVPSGGTHLGSELTRLGVPVANGIFTASLDFGNLFPGQDRWLEIRVRSAGGGGFTILDPRQKLASSPYAVQSLNAVSATNADTAQNALQLGGVAANQYVVTTDPRMTDARNPLAGSNNYIRNSGLLQQAGASLSISGSGNFGGTGNFDGGLSVGANLQVGENVLAGGTLTGNIVNATTQYNIGGNRVLSVGGTENIFAGVGAGSSTTGSGNSFFGRDAGLSNTTGMSNSFYGRSAGRSNTTGQQNVFFGGSAGRNNTGGNYNSFFGILAGTDNTTGESNSFIGYYAGRNNSTGSFNSFVGSFAGESNTTGEGNSFFGRFAGNHNQTGINNTAVGRGSNFATGNLTYATAIGSGAIASLSNSIYLGRSDGSDTVRVPGTLVVTGSTSLNGSLAVAGGASAIFTGPVFITGIPGGGGTTTLCRNGTNQLSTCSSSARYKTDITGYTSGLDVLNRLQPVSFTWKDGGMHDLGLVAEDVAAIEPLLATYNEDGQVEGVKYDRIGVVLVNAIREQQNQIDGQKSEIENLRQRLAVVEELKKLLCAQNAGGAICTEEK